jgi:glutamate-5-semialdehyde dehydrogenase
MNSAVAAEKLVAEDRHDIPALMRDIGARAKRAAAVLATVPTADKDKALRAAAAAIRTRMAEILAAAAEDVAEARRQDHPDSFIDRLALDKGRVEAMARGVEEIADLPDPVGATMARWDRPNGLVIERVRTPLGVVGVIFESRPNVTADAGALCLKAGNAAILRGGSESLRSSGAIMAALHDGLAAAGLPTDALQLVPTRDRAAVGEMLRLAEYIDVIVPRGGKSLIQRVMAETRIPTFQHLEGLCHTYIHAAADPVKARAIVLNAKMRRTGVCGATETLLVDKAAAGQLPVLLGDLIAAGCEVRGDAATVAADPRAVPATAADWDTEYLDAIIAVRVVDGLDAAIAHIVEHGSSHTDSIVTEDAAAAEAFLNRVDSAIVMVNASTQFADGGEFGMGAEIGIATGRLHARGPVGVEQLTIFKYKVRGTGQCRP